MTDSPSVTWPSPARTTLPLRRVGRTVVERISRFVGMSAILDYSSGGKPAHAEARIHHEAREARRHGETKGKSKGRQAVAAGRRESKSPTVEVARKAGPSPPYRPRPLQCTAVCRTLFRRENGHASSGICGKTQRTA